MKVTQEKRPNSQMGLEIEITPERSKQAYEQVLADYKRKVNIPGFRKGKVPRQVLIQQLGSQNLKAVALEKLIEEAASEAIAQEKIEALDKPQLVSEFEALVSQYQPGQPLTFDVAVDIPPEIKIEQYTGLTIKVEEVKYDPATVDGILEEQRHKQATLIPVEDRPAQMGDITVIDFAGRMAKTSSSDFSGRPRTVGEEGEEGETEIPGAKADEFELELKTEGFIPGFVEGIVGMQLGETKEVPLQFPEDYPQKDLSGKPALFSITLKEIKEQELPELDDEFAAEASEFETLAELRADLESKYTDRAEGQTAANKSQALMEALVEQLEVEIPASRISSEIDEMITQAVYDLAKQGVDVQKMLTKEMVASMRENSQPEAIARIKRNLAVKEIAKRESIEVSPEAIEAKMTEILDRYSNQEKEIFDEAKLREAVGIDLVREKVLGWVEEHSTIELVPEGTLQPPADPDSQEAIGQSESDFSGRPRTVGVREETALADPAPAEEISQTGPEAPIE
ncbi:MAG: trigger factor [Hormoscilla sp. SP5CHS1]|nr:trigger factor [Hormoscilla sp. SP5CHS1]